MKKIRDAGGEAHAVRCDLAIEEHRTNLVKETEETFGPIDIICNNAAVTYFVPVVDFKEKHYRLMMEVQVHAPFHLSQLAPPKMKEKGEGWISNISSHAALHPDKQAGGRRGCRRYAAGGIGAVYHGNWRAKLHKDNIGVNVISPGLVATPGVLHHKLVTDDTPEERITPVEHMAEACLRLSYGDAGEITGKITYAADMLKDYKLTPAELIA
ncbi:MAG: SDR family oxidoreductase [Gammaproteobacteria bacterium]|nr:SDR family oxidoreductase [Gammaproteobacteria bacterium]